VLGADQPGAALPAAVHWGWVLALAPVLVLASHASYRFIEAPAMRATPAVTAALRRRLQKSPDRLAA
jgi:peptidoglycan/LPS O-acetylase OafA/YrhL